MSWIWDPIAWGAFALVRLPITPLRIDPYNKQKSYLNWAAKRNTTHTLAAMATTHEQPKKQTQFWHTDYFFRSTKPLNNASPFI